jgi:hypothetical protein
MIKLLSLSLLILFTSACAHRLEPGFQNGQGDVRDFILNEAVRRGGSPNQNARLPEVRASWRFLEDDDGVIIRLPRQSYPQIEKFLLAAFGTPSYGPGETTDGGLLGGYRLHPEKGGAIQFGHDKRRTEVIVLRPVNLF